MTRNEEATEEDDETEKEEDLLYYKKILRLKKNEVFVTHSNKYGVIIVQGKLHFKYILLVVSLCYHVICAHAQYVLCLYGF